MKENSISGFILDWFSHCSDIKIGAVGKTVGPGNIFDILFVQCKINGYM